MSQLAPGLEGKISFKVEERHLAAEMSSGEVRVFATPMLVAGMEMAAVAALAGYLPEKATTVGIAVNVIHTAATPPGLTVTFKATLTEISANGKGLTFNVEAQDESGPIGKGTHQRVIVNQEEFMKRAYTKLPKI